MHPLVVVCVHGLGPQLVQVTISFGPVVAPVGGPPSRFFLPCDRVSVEETYILTTFRSNNDPSFDQCFYRSSFFFFPLPRDFTSLVLFFFSLSFRFASFHVQEAEAADARIASKQRGGKRVAPVVVRERKPSKKNHRSFVAN